MLIKRYLSIKVPEGAYLKEYNNLTTMAHWGLWFTERRAARDRLLTKDLTNESQNMITKYKILFND